MISDEKMVMFQYKTPQNTNQNSKIDHILMKYSLSLAQNYINQKREGSSFIFQVLTDRQPTKTPKWGVGVKVVRDARGVVLDDASGGPSSEHHLYGDRRYKLWNRWVFAPRCKVCYLANGKGFCFTCSSYPFAIFFCKSCTSQNFRLNFLGPR